ncbi:hypothetical protein Tco_0648996 [Tanacetum coccineum]
MLCKMAFKLFQDSFTILTVGKVLQYLYILFLRRSLVRPVLLIFDGIGHEFRCSCGLLSIKKVCLPVQALHRHFSIIYGSLLTKGLSKVLSGLLRLVGKTQFVAADRLWSIFPTVGLTVVENKCCGDGGVILICWISTERGLENDVIALLVAILLEWLQLEYSSPYASSLLRDKLLSGNGSGVTLLYPICYDLAPWLSDQLEWICGMLHGLVINWSSSAIETSRNRVNVFSFITVSIVMIRRMLGKVAKETLGIACGVVFSGLFICFA